MRVGDARRAQFAIKPAVELADRAHAAARHAARFDHDHALARFAQAMRRHEARKPGPDDKDGFRALCRGHAGLRDAAARGKAAAADSAAFRKRRRPILAPPSGTLIHGPSIFIIRGRHVPRT